MRRASALALVMLGVAGCKGDDGARGATSSDPARVTIRQGPDGKTQIDGAPEMKGDAASCAAMKACCVAPQSDVFCAIAQTEPGANCATVAEAGKRAFATKQLPKPAGCP